MTVSELIEKLKEMPQDAIVRVYGDDGEATEVALSPRYNGEAGWSDDVYIEA